MSDIPQTQEPADADHHHWYDLPLKEMTIRSLICLFYGDGFDEKTDGDHVDNILPNFLNAHPASSKALFTAAALQGIMSRYLDIEDHNRFDVARVVNVALNVGEKMHQGFDE